jgi:Ca2+-binding RTX toxin-like protein
MATIGGTSGDDILTGGAENDSLNGGAGNDELHGGDGNDSFFGGGGNDRIYGDAGNDTLFGQGGDDELYGGLGDDNILGGVGDDLLDGGEGNNTLAGEGGHDTAVVTIGTGTNVFDGGSGIDTIELTLTADQITDAIMADLEALNTWLEDSIAAAGDENALSGQTTGPELILSELGLTVSNIERVMIVVDGEATDLATFLGAESSGAASGLAAPSGFDYAFGDTDGDDQLTGTDLADYILASLGKDFVAAGAGNDEIHGGADDDRLYGGNDDDTLYGDDGNDTLVGEQGNDVLYGGAGNDSFYGGGNDDQIFGEAGDDYLCGDGGNDTLDGGDGTNYLNGGSGDDRLVHTVGATNTIVGGTGIDTAIIRLTSAQLTPEVAADLEALRDWIAAKLAAVGGDESQLAGLSGEAGLELSSLGITISDVERIIVNIDGVDVDIDALLNSPPEAPALVQASVAEDKVMVDVVQASDPDGDSLSFGLQKAAAHGVVVIDPVTGACVYTPDENFSGNDTFWIKITDPYGKSVMQQVVVNVVPVADRAELSVSDVTIDMPPPAPIIGTKGNDTIFGDNGGSVEAALDIAAALVDTDGSEVLTVVISGIPAGAILNHGTLNSDGTVTLTPAELAGLTITMPTPQSFDLTVTAITVDDGISTATNSETLSITVNGAGTANDDTIDALGGNDRIFAGEGNDRLISGAGNDHYDGGNGFDTIDFSAVNRGVTVDLEKGRASGDGNDTLTGIEGVVGSAYDDRITGNAADNVIYDGAGRDRSHGGDGNDIIHDGAGDDRAYGDNGNDTIYGGAGNDRYYGGAGYDTIDYSEADGPVDIDLDRNRATGVGIGSDRLSGFEAAVGSAYDDTLRGSKGSDTLDGGAGDDTIRGGSGADLLTGGEGADTFVYDLQDLKVGTYDTITDFDPTQDVFDFSDLDYLSRNAPDDEDRVWLVEQNGGVMVLVDMSNLPGATEIAFLEGVTAAELSGTDWYSF